MLRSLWLSMIYGAFLCAGLVAPFALGLGYVWVDTFSPQHVAYSILTEIPVSAIMAVATVGAYLLMDRKSPPRPNAIMVLIVIEGLWVSYTTQFEAVAPEWAWMKYDWAIKTIGFAAFMPYLFRSRVQIEAFWQVYVFAAAAQTLPYGAKTILSGGSYHANLGLLSGNSGLAEGSTLSTVAIMAVPIILWLARRQVILPRIRLVWAIYIGLAVAGISASLGTYERTGLVAVVVLGVGLWLQSRHKLRYGVWGGLAVVGLAAVLIRPGSDWMDRMSTITDYNQEASSLGRILVWKWTLGFAQTHPLGGGFNSYVVDTISFPAGDGGVTPIVIHGKAFHSMYFEALGEHGWPGLGLLLGLLGTSFLTLVRVVRKCRRLVDMEWCADLARALMVTEAVLVACGNFIGIGFQPEVYYLFAGAAMLACHVRGVERAGRPVPLLGVPEPGGMAGEPVYI
jgi:probable O-glycosylation ligase (exosortase A-associated)